MAKWYSKIIFLKKYGQEAYLHSVLETSLVIKCFIFIFLKSHHNVFKPYSGSMIFCSIIAKSGNLLLFYYIIKFQSYSQMSFLVAGISGLILIFCFVISSKSRSILKIRSDENGDSEPLVQET